MTLLLGIDFGTSYFKVGLFDAAGAMRGLGRVAVEKHSPAPGRSELPVAEFWRLLRTGLADALAQADASAREIVGLSYSSQANTFLLLDHNDEPLTPLVIWTDRRAHPVEQAMVEFGCTEHFQRTAGFAGLTAEFMPVKWRWYQRHEPAVWGRAKRIMTLSDYFTFAMTGEAVGDTSTAAFTGLYSTSGGEWWPEALEFFEVPRTSLSRPLKPGTACGRTLPRVLELMGLPSGVRFAVGGLDHLMAAIGSGIDRLADASISTGTVLAALILVEAVEPVADCYHGPHVEGRFFRLAFDLDGAGQLEDYQRLFAPNLSISQLVALAATVQPRASPESVVAEFASRRHGAVIRGMMERISATHRTLLRRVQGMRTVRRVIATGGGARSNTWLQINADMLDAIIIAPRCHERACLGAAAFGAVAAEIYGSCPEALLAMVHSDRVVEPQTPNVAIYAEKWSHLERT
jgi:xylulokinase